MAKFYGSRMKALRKRANWTQQQLADEIGVDKRQVIRYEKEEAEPLATTLGMMAEKLSSSTDYLVGRTEIPDPCLVETDLTDEEREIILALRHRQGNRAMQALAAATKGFD